MGKRLKQQRRGANERYLSPKKGKTNLAYRANDDVEKTASLKGKVVEFVDDPVRDSLLMRVKFDNQEEHLYLAPEHISLGDYIEEGAQASLTRGSVLPLYRLPEGAYVFNVERRPGDGGSLVKTPGSYAVVAAKEGNKVFVRLPSKKTIILLNECRAQLGVVAGGGRLEKPLYKAGNSFYKMRAKHRLWPTLRGVHMAPYTHPHGGKQHHVGKPTTVARGTPPGGKVGHIAARSTGRRKTKKTAESSV